jgi:ceramide glucosyltransferase
MILFLLVFGCFGLLTSTVFAGMVLAGTRHFQKDFGSAGRGEAFTPALTLLKPLHGNEPGLEAHLTTFFEQDYPEYEVLFCARDEDDAGMAVARRVAARFPQIPTRFFSTIEPKFINAKVHSLEMMAAAAAHPILVISDSDVRVTPDYLRAVAEPFADEAVGGMTCLYRGVAAEGGLWARLEAVGMSVEMTAGVLVANMLEGMQFVLGPTMAFRKEVIGQMGGFAVTADYCADDFVLGNETYKLGWKVALSHHTIDHMVLNSSFFSSMKHQVRWMKSTRFSRPKGHFGTSLTFAMPFGILAGAAAAGLGHPVAGALLFGWGVLTRLAIGWATGWLVLRSPKMIGLLALYPIRDLMGFCFWVASYTSGEILWRGRVFKLLPGGKMR